MKLILQSLTIVFLLIAVFFLMATLYELTTWKSPKVYIQKLKPPKVPKA